MSKSARGGTISPPVSAFDSACRSLARRRLTTAELRQRLLKRHPEAEVELAIGKLLEYRYLDDDTLIADYIKERMRFSPRSAELLEAELERRGIEPQNFQHVFQIELPDYDEREVARQALSSELKKLRHTPAQGRREKTLRFLRSRGFSYDVMMEMWEELKKGFRDAPSEE